MDYQALVFAVWSAIHPHAGKSGDAPVIAAAIATAVSEDEARGAKDGPIEAALLAVFAWHESNVQMVPFPDSWDSKAGLSCGPWQQSCEAVRGMAALGQARRWLGLLHEGTASCPKTPLAPISGGCEAARKVGFKRLYRATMLLQKVSVSDDGNLAKWLGPVDPQTVVQADRVESLGVAELQRP